MPDNRAPITQEEADAVQLLTEKGYGVVMPDAVWWNANIAKSDPGAMVLTTDRKPIFGMVAQHEVKPS